MQPLTEVQSFFVTVLGAFESIAAESATEADIQVGGERWRLRFAGQRFQNLYFPALSHLAISTEEFTGVALTVCLWTEEETGYSPLPLPWDWEYRLPHAYHNTFEGDRYSATLLFTGLYIFIDRIDRIALVFVKSLAQLPVWDFASPLRDLIELWFKRTPKSRVHGGAVGSTQGGVLLAGTSGIGKSTTTIACLLAGIGYAGDDSVLVDSESATGYSLYNSGKVLPDNLERLPELRPHVMNVDSMLENKAICFLGEVFPDRMLLQFPVRAIMVPRVTGRPESRLIPASPIAAIRALTPTIFMQTTAATPEDFDKITRFSRSVPCYGLEAGTDLPALVKLITDFLGHD
jgi:hypothetical protein